MLLGWPIVGMIIESYGFFALFRCVDRKADVNLHRFVQALKRALTDNHDCVGMGPQHVWTPLSLRNTDIFN